MLDSEQGQGGQFQMGKRGRGQVEGRIKVEWGYGDEVVLVGGQNGRVQGWKVLSVCLPLHVLLSIDEDACGRHGDSSPRRDIQSRSQLISTGKKDASASSRTRTS